ncbi:methionyl-tRNA formyltransferase [Rubritalea spongiae]|uniref:Methionyl-tRNA formyltransferase n=1 Tax=Rubritalea spongiae TaxID=430797 RepID=A0ABW5E5I8_9BACT
MKCVLFCSHKSSLFTALYLLKNGHLSGVVAAGNSPEFVKEIEVFSRLHKIAFKLIESDKTLDGLADWIIKTEAKVIIVNTFSHKIPSTVLDSVPCGAWNIHSGALPEYRGPVPVFWQLRNGETQLTLSLHQMTAKLDSGPVFDQLKIELCEADTHDVALNRANQRAPELIEKLFNSLATDTVTLTPQDESLANYQTKPNQKDFTINWERMDSKAIRNLVRACNLIAGGAISYYKSMEFRIYEVVCLPLNDPPDEPPGTIATITGDPNLYVLCRDSALLRMNVLGFSEAVCSGDHFKKMLDVKSGEKFTSSMEVNT